MADRDLFTKSTLFERALRGILRPLVRALIAQGVAAPAFYRIVKRTYVEVAEAELTTPTDSAISVATGVHRRDVKTFRQPEEADTGERRRFSMLATVVGRWLSDPTLLDANGEPRPLPRSGDGGFDSLVQEVSRDIRPRAVLDELLRQGVVRMDGEMVALDAQALVGSANLDQKLHFFSLNLGDHMNAAVDNLLAEKPPFLERAVFYDLLTRESVDQIEAETRAIWVEALLKINANARAHQARDSQKDDATHRFRFGVFFYSEDEVDEEQKGGN
ncbi:MAG: DUF6502 family protein [Pseudomonadota bacterium]